MDMKVDIFLSRLLTQTPREGQHAQIQNVAALGCINSSPTGETL